MIKKTLNLGIFLFLILFASQVNASSTCSVYFSGIGCPHCSKSDPIVLDKIFDKYSNLVVVDYEVYHNQFNAPLMRKYDKTYKTSLGIPLMIFNRDNLITGDKKILKQFDSLLKNSNNNECLLPNGEKRLFSDLDLNALEGNPKFWVKDRVLIRGNGGLDSDILRKLLFSSDKEMLKVLESLSYKTLNDLSEDISGGEINFENAVQLDGWIFRWNGDNVKGGNINNTGVLNTEKNNKQNNISIVNKNINNQDFTLTKIISLALVDAINPCALAVLLLMLTSILAYNPKDKRNLVLSGLAFIISIFIMYLFYGLIIIKFIKLVQLITSLRVWVYKSFGVLAIILGILNIKDYIKYKPGSVGTEMPLFMRPKVKAITEKITSPSGAFLMGIFVTLFLLPCTIGPYIICCGLLSMQNIINSLPLLLLYNFIFVLPMIFILAFVVFGLRKVEDISVWKENNINKLHLVEGIIMFLLGAVMLFGLI